MVAARAPAAAPAAVIDASPRRVSQPYSDRADPLLYELYNSDPQAVGAKFGAMQYAKLETAALAHVDDSYFYGAYCRKCKHAARLSLENLRVRLGDTFSLRRVKDRLRCERCRSRQIVITFLAPDQKTGNVANLFQEMPRN